MNCVSADTVDWKKDDIYKLMAVGLRSAKLSKKHTAQFFLNEKKNSPPNTVFTLNVGNSGIAFTLNADETVFDLEGATCLP